MLGVWFCIGILVSCGSFLPSTRVRSYTTVFVKRKRIVWCATAGALGRLMVT